MGTLIRIWALISKIGMLVIGKDDIVTHVASSTCISVAVIKNHGRKQLGKEFYLAYNFKL